MARAGRLLPVARAALQGFPALAITGPKQAGKTTLAKQLGGAKPYASLEDPDTRQFAESDPRGFLGQFRDEAVLDEVQCCPSIFSYLQGVLDSDQRMVRFILTGSQQFGLVRAITKSLAGRVAMLNLLPFSLPELQAADRAPKDLGYSRKRCDSVELKIRSSTALIKLWLFSRISGWF